MQDKSAILTADPLFSGFFSSSKSICRLRAEPYTLPALGPFRYRGKMLLVGHMWRHASVSLAKVFIRMVLDHTFDGSDCNNFEGEHVLSMYSA